MKTLFAIVAVTGLALAQEPGERKMPAGFKEIARLAGTWEGEDGAKVTYRLVSAGSVVLETLVHGKAVEMVTVYHGDGEDLVMTHYCSLGNQPHMEAGPGPKAGSIRFACAGGTNLKCATDLHMHALTLTFVDADHLTQEWTMVQGGQEKHTATFHLVRKKE